MSIPKAPNKDVNEFAAKLRNAGWSFETVDSHGHIVYMWHGQTVALPSSPRPRGAWRRRAAHTVVEAMGDECPRSIRDLAYRTSTRANAKLTPSVSRDARIEAALPDRPVLAIVPSRRDLDWRAVTALLRVCVARHDNAAISKCHAALKALESRCTVHGCPARFHDGGPNRLCAMHADDDAFTDVNIRFYQQMMEAA